MSTNKYVIVTPAQNEEAYIRFTLDSVVAQTIWPIEWIIVDDGSTDATSEIVRDYTKRYEWIKLVVNHPKETQRDGGGKLMNAFLLGYHSLGILDYDFIVKLDADLTLPPNYFEEVGKAFESDPRIGLSGGHCFALTNGVWKKERAASYHLRGAIKAFRKVCYVQIGGMLPGYNADFLDEMTAMHLGWLVKILPLEVKHHRRTSTLINRGLRFSFKMGRVYYKDGYDFLLVLLRAIVYGSYTKPYGISAVGLLMGYVSAVMTRPKKDVSPELELFIRKFQYRRIRSGIARIFTRSLPGHEFGADAEV
jgi:glycosyltransferase involved in cell wall biosynthesis